METNALQCRSFGVFDLLEGVPCADIVESPGLIQRGTDKIIARGMDVDAGHIRSVRADPMLRFIAGGRAHPDAHNFIGGRSEHRVLCRVEKHGSNFFGMAGERSNFLPVLRLNKTATLSTPPVMIRSGLVG